MASFIHLSCLGLLMFIIIIVQSETSIETSNDMKSSKTSINNEQLYELYKIMRTDPRLASVSNQEIVSYIYRNFILGNMNPIEHIQGKIYKQRQQHRKNNPIE